LLPPAFKISNEGGRMARCIVERFGPEATKATDCAKELLRQAEIRLNDNSTLAKNVDLSEASCREAQMYYIRAWRGRQRRKLRIVTHKSPAKTMEPQKWERKELHPNRRHEHLLSIAANRRKAGSSLK
jgi:hypothetical protein